MADKKEKPNDNLEQEIKQRELLNSLEDDSLQKLQRRANIAKENLESAKQSRALSEQIADLEEKRLKTAETAADVTDAQIKNLIAERDLLIAQGKLTGEERKKREQELKDLKDRKKLEDQHLEHLQKAKNLSKDTAKEATETLANSLGLSNITQKLTSQFAAGAGMAGIWKVAFSEAVVFAAQSFAKIADANSEFAAATGQIANNSLMFGAGLSNYGIGFEKLSKANATLFTDMSAYSALNKDIQKDLAESTAKLENLGISAATSAKNYDLLTKNLRMSATEAKRTNEEIARAAIGAGIAPSKMVGEFAQNMGKLSAYGKQGIDVFVALEKQAKSLGLQVQQLTAIIGDQFDTFEGSARAAGKLNAVLGGNYLNSVEMLNATESERIVLLKKSFDESGKNFDSLGKYEKKAIAATLGIKDLDEASRLFGNSTGDLTADMEKQAAKQEELEKVQREAAKVTERLSQMFNQLMIIIKPLVELFVFFTTVIANINDWFGGLGGTIWLLAGAIAFGSKASFLFSGALKMVGIDLSALSLKAMTTTGVMNSLKAAFAGVGIFGWISIIMMLVSAFQMLHDVLMVPHSPILYLALIMLPFIIIAIGEAAEQAEEGLEALGKAVLMIGIGVGVAAGGLALLVGSFKDLTGPQMAAALAVVILLLGGFAAAVWFLVTSTAPLSPGLIFLGIAFLFLGAGVALAGLGLSLIVKSMTSLTDPKIFLGIASLAAGLYLLTPVLFALSLFSIPLIGVGLAFLLLGTGLTLAGAGVKLLSEGLPLLASEETSDGIYKLSIGLLMLSSALLIAAPMLYLLALAGPGLLLVAGAFIMLGIATAIASTSIKIIGDSLGLVADGLNKLSNSDTITGALKLAAALLILVYPLTIFSFAIPTLIGLGVAFGLINISLTGLGEKITAMSDGFSSLASEEVSSGISNFTKNLITLARNVFLFGLVSGPLLSIAISTSIVGMGAKMLGEGIKLIAENIGKLKGSGAIFSELATGISDLMFSFMTMGVVGLLGGGLGFIAIAAGISMMVLAITALGAAINSIPENKAVTLTALNETLTTVKSLTEEDIQPTKKFVVAVKDYYEAQSRSKDIEKDALVAALRQAMTSSQAAKAEQKVKLIITGNELARALKTGDTLVDAKMTMGAM